MINICGCVCVCVCMCLYVCMCECMCSVGLYFYKMNTKTQKTGLCYFVHNTDTDRHTHTHTHTEHKLKNNPIIQNRKFLTDRNWYRAYFFTCIYIYIYISNVHSLFLFKVILLVFWCPENFISFYQ